MVTRRRQQQLDQQDRSEADWSAERDGDRRQGKQRQATGQKTGAKHGGPSRITDIHGAVTTKYNQVFMLCDGQGDIVSGDHGYGLYFRDMCYLDQLELRLCGQRAIPLLADAGKGSEAVFELTNPHLQLPDGRALPKERLSIRRSYVLHHHVTMRLEIRNLDRAPVALEVDLALDSHFEDMLVIRGFLKEPVTRGTLQEPEPKGRTLTFRYDGADEHVRTTTVAFKPKPDTVDGGRVAYRLALKPRDTQTIEVTLDLEDQQSAVPPSRSAEDQRSAVPPSRSEEGEGPKTGGSPGSSQTPHTDSEKHSVFDSVLAHQLNVETSNALFDRALQRSFDDLRVLATASQEDAYVAAGIPWYVALFGRDSCITAFETLAFQPDLARSTLRVLARYQGTKHDDFQDEEPGKILHELRVGEAANLREIPMVPYYGSVDSTPWFLMLLAEYVRWTRDLDLFHELRENVLRAVAWMDKNEKSPVTGFLSYGTRSERGLINQGWKDSDNGIVNEDGSLVQPPVALVEVQGYSYRARRDVAELLRAVGEADRAAYLERQADGLKQRFQERFWMRDKGFYGLALERTGRLSQAIASNAGHTLFTRIAADDATAKAVADRLLQDDMFCGWGIRTLSASEVAYNPLDYQVGSVWPHDNALIALGMRQWGLTQQMERIFTGIFQAATQFTHFRLPEVFDGFSQSQYGQPVQYPVACRPQAWAAGALPLLLQTALGLEPHALEQTLHIHRPHLPAWLTDVTVRALRVGGASVDLRYQRDGDTTLVAVLRRTGDLNVTVAY